MNAGLEKIEILRFSSEDDHYVFEVRLLINYYLGPGDFAIHSERFTFDYVKYDDIDGLLFTENSRDYVIKCRCDDGIDCSHPKFRGDFSNNIYELLLGFDIISINDDIGKSFLRDMLETIETSGGRNVKAAFSID